MAGGESYFTCTECLFEKERDHFIRPPEDGTRAGGSCPVMETCYTCDLTNSRNSGERVPPYYLVIAAIERRTGECYRLWANTPDDPRCEELTLRMRDLAGIDPAGKPMRKSHAGPRKPHSTR